MLNGINLALGYDMDQSKEGNYQEWVKSSTTPDPPKNIWKSEKNTGKYHAQENQEVSPFPVCDHKAERNRQTV